MNYILVNAIFKFYFPPREISNYTSSSKYFTIKADDVGMTQYYKAGDIY